MNKFFASALAAFVFFFAASAVPAADLPSRLFAPAPIFTQATTTTGPFVGIRGGYGSFDRQFNLGANAGYDFGFVRGEAAYDRLSARRGNLFSANAIGQYRLGAFTPYVLGGLGFLNDSQPFGMKPYNAPVWNVGAGVRYNLTSRVALDARYRYIQAFRSYNGFNFNTDLPVNGRFHDHVITTGIEYRF